MSRTLCTALFAVGVIVAGSNPCLGQMMGRGGMGFGMGQSAFSQGGFGTGGFGNAGFGATRFGSGGFGNAGFGATRFGSGGFGGGGFGGGFGGGGLGMGGFGQQQFGGGMGGMGATPGFVGRDAMDMQAVFQQMGRAAMQPSMQPTRTTRSRRDRTPPAATPDPPQTLRIQLQVGFDAPRPTNDAVAVRVRDRLGKILAERNMTRPELTMVGDIAVLRGVAASDSERMVIERLVALEPGVRAVQNEMTVAGVPGAEFIPASDN